jgi:hypothetical protein
MFPPRLFWTLIALPLLRMCSPQPDPPLAASAVAAQAPVFVTVRPPPAAARPAPMTYKAVLVAGDGRLPVFDNAVQGVEARLRAAGAGGRADIQRLSAAGDTLDRDARIRLASRANILAVVAAMKPAPGQGCFVFATSHGGQWRGLWLAANQEYLTPDALDLALSAGCGEAPTVVVMSGCYTGIFARPPMTRPNRIVLTAARSDRTSFGCGAGRTYTAYDKCLLDALDKGGTWPVAYGLIERCVLAEERRSDVAPSGPQAWFGPRVVGLPVPTHAAMAQR